MPRRLFILGSLLVAACGGGSGSPSQPDAGGGGGGGGGGATAISPQVAAQISSTLGAQVPALAARSSNHALAAEAAALAAQAGGKATAVTLTASLLGPQSPPTQPRSAALSSGTAQAFGFQLVVAHAPGTTGPVTFSGVLAFQGGSQLVLVAGPSPAAPIPPAIGVLISAPGLWVASTGQEQAQLQQENEVCPVALPSFVTSCKLAQFIGAGFDISGSTPANPGATGSRTASLPSSSLAGVSLAIDCALTTLCGGATSTQVQVTVVPGGAALVVGESKQFSARVSNTSDPAVTWSVAESTGGQIDASGLYTPPSTPGEYTVRATSHFDSTKFGEAKVRVTPAGVVFFDDTFANADWEMVVYVGGNGGTGSALQLQAGGDPGEARQITHHLNVGPPGAISSVFTFHLWQGMKFDPATDHAIASIDFAEDMRYPAARAQGSGLAVRQSGKVYYALPSYLISANADWKHRVVLGLTAGDFVLINSDASQGAGHPDFSASGAAIEVGFLRANSTSIGGPAYDTSGEVDNWWVNVHPVP